MSVCLLASRHDALNPVKGRGQGASQKAGIVICGGHHINPSNQTAMILAGRGDRPAPAKRLQKPAAAAGKIAITLH
ncbi:MAG: hypothetical protein R8G34_10980 [Paracoccaceae bacterium]|nr:hypothetical protein [Paracoccaceae bacterium]